MVTIIQIEAKLNCHHISKYITFLSTFIGAESLHISDSLSKELAESVSVTKKKLEIKQSKANILMVIISSSNILILQL